MAALALTIGIARHEPRTHGGKIGDNTPRALTRVAIKGVYGPPLFPKEFLQGCSDAQSQRHRPMASIESS